MAKLALEKIDCFYPELFGGVEIVYRSKIPGGWLVLIQGDKATPGVFIPDPKHEWDGNSLP